MSETPRIAGMDGRESHTRPLDWADNRTAPTEVLSTLQPGPNPPGREVSSLEHIVPDGTDEPQVRRPVEWAEIAGIKILDPDGWRHSMAKDFEEPITRDEFDERVWMCTIQTLRRPGDAG